MNKVSIIIPTYNVVDYLGECLSSVFNQSYQNFEVIVVDGGSIDGTLNIVRNFQQKYGSKIKLLNQEKELGVAGARNLGIEKSTGEIICFLDGDDFLLENSILLRVRELASDDNTKIVFSDAFVANGNKKTGKKYLATRVVDFSEGLFSALVMDNPIITSSVMLKKDILDKVGLFLTEKENKSEDLDLWIRIAVQDYGYRFLAKPTLFYRYRKGSLSESKIPMIKGRLYIFDKLLGKNLSSDKVKIVGKARNRYLKELEVEKLLLHVKGDIKNGNYKEARDKFRKILRERPGFKNYAIMTALKITPSLLRKVYLSKNEK